MFSVVIPLHDKRPFIGRCLDSVAAQQPAAAEIVVVNDGSTDGGDAVARSRAAVGAGPLIRVIDQPRRGVSAARNAGLAAATQPHVAFLDADDRWRPGFLARIRGLIDGDPAAVLYGTGFVTVREGHDLRCYGARAADIVGGRIDLFAALSRGHVLHPSSTVVPRNAALAVGGFPEGVAYCEDYWFWTKLALSGPVVLAPEPLVEYDVGVPGQAVEYWQTGYRRRFDVLEFHRFLADELRRRGPAAVTPLDRSFTAYARRQLATAVWQRLYWGDFGALERLSRELDLGSLPLGWPTAACGWLTAWPAARPVVGAAVGLVRAAREACRRAVRDP